MVVFCFIEEQAHSSVERAGLLGGVKLRSLQPDGKRRLRGDTLREAIEEDTRNGLIPFYVRLFTNFFNYLILLRVNSNNIFQFSSPLLIFLISNYTYIPKIE